MNQNLVKVNKKKLDVLILVIIILASFYFNSLIFKNTKVLNNNNFIDDNYISFKSTSENSFNKNLILIYFFLVKSW